MRGGEKGEDQAVGFFSPHFLSPYPEVYSLLACFQHNVNSELEDAEKEGRIFFFQRKIKTRQGRGGEGSAEEDKKGEHETEDGRERE